MTVPEVGSGMMIDGRYRILSRVGSGGMADVFCAEDQQLGRRVALKLLHRRFSEDPDFVERFRREAQAAAGLQHPNVVSVYDRGDYEGIYYIAMEYLPGRSLKQIIREEAPIEPVRAIDITLQILKAARFAHRHGVIHRDLKPHNVIVDDAGHAKVTDFGIARAGASDMTETGSIMGTAQYLSPEQAQGHAVSAASDVYSVAVVLYELLTGRVPFDAESAVTIALKHVSEAPTTPTAINPRIPPELEQIVLWGLNKNPADRPQDADQFIAALEAARASILAGETGQRTASMAAVGGAVVPAADAALVPAAAAAMPPFVTDPAMGVTEPPPGAPPERPDRNAWPWLALLLILLLGGAAAAYFLTRPAQAVLPAVVGEPLNTARTVLQNDGFSSINVLSVVDQKPAQTVIGENPAAGKKVDTSSVVTLTVSSGPGSVNVPSVLGNTVRQAKTLLEQAGLKAGSIEHQASSSVPNGEVIETSPAAGVSVPGGSKVTLVVSSGPAKVGVPDVTGESEAQAKSDLHAAGFEVSTTDQTSSSVPAGDVISQSPTGNTQALPGTTVALVVAKAPTAATKANVPSVTGQNAGAAQATLQGAGFKVVQQPKKVIHSARNGIVLSQSPGGGTSVPKGSTVTITVGKYTPRSGSTGATGATGIT